MSAATALAALAAATGLHLGFQLTVTAVVYPALRRVPAEHWSRQHQAHSRAITPLVGLVYGALVVGSAWALLAVPLGGATGALVVLAVVAAATAVGLTAGGAAPTHGRLAAGRDEALLRRLVRFDLGRTTAAAVAFTAAAVAVLVGT